MELGTYFGIVSALFTSEYIIQPHDVFGIIFKKNSPEQFVRFDSVNVSLTIDKNDSIIFLTHGWMETRSVDWYQDMTEALLKQNENDVVVQVDWSKGSRQQRPYALKNNEPAGNAIGKFIHNLIKYNNLTHAQLHLIGFSMGGQVSAFASKKLLAVSGHRPGRITALDPSGRGYNDRPPSDRLNPEDAEVVVVLHTDKDVIGFRYPCGTVDLYVNGGKYQQPGCPDKLDIIELRYCSHYRAFRYFIEAIRKGSLMGTKCESYEAYKNGFCEGNEKLNFVGNISRYQRGVYYRTTNSESPFLE